ncbi:MAG: ATP-grasp domain-containing protein [Kiloniellales bacterium]
MSRPLLIVAISGRTLAAAARRAGFEPVVIDLFNDLDTRTLAIRSQAVAGSIDEGFETEALLAAAIADPDLQLVYGAGFEDRPELLARLAAGRRLYGNAPETLARIKDPAYFFRLLDRLAVPHPEIALGPPEADAGWPGGWLVKRIGGAGGAHVRAARREGAVAGHYFQRRSEGRSVSALFLANGRDALTLGFSLQWGAPGRGLGFLFGGAAQPARFEPAIAETMAGILPRLVAETGLVGLNSADFLVRPDGFELLEINPRPGATLDIFDKAPQGAGEDAGQGLLALHLAACDGVLPPTWWPAPGASACAVLYAPRDLTVPKHFAWPGWAADRPDGGSAIPAGAPLCTVLAETAETSDVDRVRQLVEQRSRQLLRAIEHPGADALLGAA